MSYLVGRWFNPDGTPKFVAWTEDKPGAMHEAMTNWIATGATIEILDYVPNEVGESRKIDRIYRWRDHLEGANVHD